jgi:hypothetical protein
MCDHAWLWPNNWERYCPRCGTVESYENGAIGMVSVPACWADSKFGQTLQLARAQTARERGIARSATRLDRTYGEALRNAWAAGFDSDSKE